MMRPGLAWLLAGSLALSAAALWWPQEPEVLAPPASSEGQAFSPVQAIQPPASPAALPQKLPGQSLEPAQFDPFAGVQPPAPPPPKPAPVAAPMPPSLPQPVAPALSYRYLGQMLDPRGEQRIYLSKSDEAVVISIGTRLDEGYVVEAIGPEGIRLHYPPLDAHAIIPVPPAPEPDRR